MFHRVVMVLDPGSDHFFSEPLQAQESEQAIADAPHVVRQFIEANYGYWTEECGYRYPSVIYFVECFVGEGEPGEESFGSVEHAFGGATHEPDFRWKPIHYMGPDRMPLIVACVDNVMWVTASPSRLLG